jgi:GT2 family glycosyltransferase
VKPRVSVIVPTFRRDDLLANCLAALCRQSLPPEEYEILVADNAGSTETADLVKRMASAHAAPLTYVAAHHRRGPAAARNAGWRSSRGEVLAFTDDDCVPDAGWLRAGLAAIDDGADAVSGRLMMPLPDRPTDYERDAAGLASAEFVTANCFCRRTALEAVGGFDERFTAAWREDSDLQFSLLERGFCIQRAADAIVVHPIRPAGWGISLRQQSKSLFDVLLKRKHPRLYRERIPPFPPDYYGLALAIGMAGVGIASGQRLLAAAGAIGWAALTARFCFRRLQGTSRHPKHVGEMIITSLLIPLLSLFWRLRGEWEFRAWGPSGQGSEGGHATPHVPADGAGRPVQSAL